jgi:DNA-binding MarR family transcriptional regulator
MPIKTPARVAPPARRLARRAVANPRPQTPARELPPLDQGGLTGLIGYHLRMAQISVFRDFAETTRAYDVSPGWVGLLTLIRQNPGLTQSRLAQAIGIDRSTLVNSLDRLQARRLVLRRASRTDRRANLLELTPAGESLLAEVTPLIAAHEARIERCLGAGNAEGFLQMLMRLEQMAALGDPA